MQTITESSPHINFSLSLYTYSYLFSYVCFFLLALFSVCPTLANPRRLFLQRTRHRRHDLHLQSFSRNFDGAWPGMEPCWLGVQTQASMCLGIAAGSCTPLQLEVYRIRRCSRSLSCKCLTFELSKHQLEFYQVSVCICDIVWIDCAGPISLPRARIMSI